MATVTIDRLTAAVPLDRPRADALVASFAACGADYERAFLESQQVVGQIDPPQQVCLADAMGDGLIEAIVVSVLVDDELDPALSAEYAAALDACTA